MSTREEKRRAVLKQISMEMRERDMTQQGLADAVGVSRGAMSRYLNGHAELSYGQLMALADAFEMPLSELIRRAEIRAQK